jgi:tRNA U38,U39,U40 pseudouridine synthase TruA
MTIDHKAALEAAKRIVEYCDASRTDKGVHPDEFELVSRAYIERERQIKDAISAIYRDAQLTIDSIYEAGMLGALRIIREKLGVLE